jgi:hypothetical protein
MHNESSNAIEVQAQQTEHRSYGDSLGDSSRAAFVFIAGMIENVDGQWALFRLCDVLNEVRKNVDHGRVSEIDVDWGG